MVLKQETVRNRDGYDIGIGVAMACERQSAPMSFQLYIKSPVAQLS